MYFALKEMTSENHQFVQSRSHAEQDSKSTKKYNDSLSEVHSFKRHAKWIPHGDPAE